MGVSKFQKYPRSPVPKCGATGADLTQDSKKLVFRIFGILYSRDFLGMGIFLGWGFFSLDGISHRKATYYQSHVKFCAYAELASITDGTYKTLFMIFDEYN